MGHLYEHDTVFELLGAVVGFRKTAVKASEGNEMRRKKRVFMRMNFSTDLVAQFS